MPGQRISAAGSTSLELDGKNVGVLRSASGGDAFADVVTSPGKSFYTKKTAANVHYDPFTLEVGFAMATPLYDWISASLTGRPAPKKGAVVESDANGVVRARREFSAAVLSEVTFPACDGAAKEAAFLKLKLVPEQVAAAKGSGKAAPPLVKQKPWVSSSFRLDIDGLDTQKVAKVDSFTVKQTVGEAVPLARGAARQVSTLDSVTVKQTVGEPVRMARAAARLVSTLDFPNLRVTFAAASAQTWVDWFDDFVLAGASSDANEKSGTLRFLAPNLTDELGQVRFFNLGIFKLAAEAGPTTAIKRMVADLYCERLELSITP